MEWIASKNCYRNNNHFQYYWHNWIRNWFPFYVEKTLSKAEVILSMVTSEGWIVLGFNRNGVFWQHMRTWNSQNFFHPLWQISFPFSAQTIWVRCSLSLSYHLKNEFFFILFFPSQILVFGWITNCFLEKLSSGGRGWEALSFFWPFLCHSLYNCHFDNLATHKKEEKT